MSAIRHAIVLTQPQRPVDYVHAPRGRLLGMFDRPLERRYREYWQQSYTKNARRGIIASLLIFFVLSVLNDADNMLWSGDAVGGSTTFLHFLAMRVGGLAIVSLSLVLFRHLQPGQWGYSVWPRWSVPVHVTSLLLVCVVWVEACIAAVQQAQPGDVSLNLIYSLLLILIPSQCATFLHLHHTMVTLISVCLLVTSIVLTCLYTEARPRPPRRLRRRRRLLARLCTSPTRIVRTRAPDRSSSHSATCSRRRR